MVSDRRASSHASRLPILILEKCVKSFLFCSCKKLAIQFTYKQCNRGFVIFSSRESVLRRFEERPAIGRTFIYHTLGRCCKWSNGHYLHTFPTIRTRGQYTY
ncbi:hypothetical protein CEXT_297771 [Caerostris extrusa]|uniref:Uncharacterized protein n=1 Tax=Caerostris extrusa TaxID=172846 RepID=A0AAV4WZJ2_CAEEX|nr:hypothetical protein CEXT_297771 [Caerostris extrusa]